METQLHYDNKQKQLGLRFREKFVTDFGVVLKVQCPRECAPQANA